LSTHRVSERFCSDDPLKICRKKTKWGTFSFQRPGLARKYCQELESWYGGVDPGLEGPAQRRIPELEGKGGRPGMRKRDNWQSIRISAEIFKLSMGAWNRVGRTGLAYRPAKLHSLAELAPWNRFLGSLKV
jgi:hypothetical protein